jgi:putative aldouronate transport system permease protein
MVKTREYKIIQFIAHATCLIGCALVIVPFALLVIASFTDNAWATANGFSFFPKEWSLSAYSYIGAQFSVIGKAYIMTIIVTLIGTSLSLLITSMFAYALNRDDLVVMKVLNFMLVFTMLFNGGLVATYYSYVKYFHVRDTIWGLILPNLLMNAFNVILVRNYYRNSIPYSLLEATYLDGANEWQVYAKVVLPLSKPMMATIGLMTALSYWNDWQNGLYYLSLKNGAKYYTIQVLLNNINENIQILRQNASKMMGVHVEMPSLTIRMAIATVGILPILVIYPFFQQYFVKGITLGGVKE